MQTVTDINTLRAVTHDAARIFTERARHLAALSYLRQRGILGTHLASNWMLGYAPPGWTRMVDKLANRYPEQALIDAGVARRSSRGTLIDTFRDRIIFGIRDPEGQVAGFIGRDLSGGLRAPKYLNTPQSPLFDKSRLLFGLPEGTQAGTPQQPVVVEGPLDVLAIIDRAGASGTTSLLPIAACGTSFTDSHARRVAEAAFTAQSPVVVAMDADNAGRSAATRVGEQLRRTGLDVRIALLPNGSDPCEYLSNAAGGVEAFRHDHAVPLVTVHAEQAIAAQGDQMQWIEGRLGATRAITRYLATYPPSYAARQVGWLADTLDLHHTTITRELATAYEERRAVPTPEAQQPAASLVR
ncbi:MAG TPA: toprim domain-containing protein [Mycobacteriales bacterium]|nr:toprim domain-containing protein [Mycobacteriales bacterium]